MQADLLKQAADAVAVALEAGADDAVSAVSWGRSLEFQFRDGRLEKVQENMSRGLGVSLYVDGRFSSHSTNDMDPTRLRGFLDEAVALTRLLEPDPYRLITPPELYEGRADVDLQQVDRGLVDLDRETRVDWCRTLADAASDHEEVISSTSGVMDSHSVSARVASNGFEAAVERTSVWYGCETTIREGEHKRPEAYRWVGGSHLEGLPSPAETGAEALRRVLARRGAAKIPSCRTTMIVDREAAPSLLGRIFGAMGAGSIQQKRSFLADKLHGSVASSALTMRDDPFRPRSLASCLFDGEGIATRKRDIIVGGDLQMFFVDTYYGRKLGWEPTTSGTSNVVFDHGDQDLAGLVAGCQDGIYVTSWLGGNANMTTGDFSFGLRGHAVRGGALAEPISEMNVTGNYSDLLQKLAVVGNDPLPWSTFRSPTLLFEDIQFSGS